MQVCVPGVAKEGQPTAGNGVKGMQLAIGVIHISGACGNINSSLRIIIIRTMHMTIMKKRSTVTKKQKHWQIKLSFFDALISASANLTTVTRSVRIGIWIAS